MCVCVCVCASACGIVGAREIGGGRVSLILVSDNILHQESSDPNEKKERKKTSISLSRIIVTFVESLNQRSLDGQEEWLSS